MSEINDLKKEIEELEHQIFIRKQKLEPLIDAEESKKLPKWSRHECIYCHKHRAGRPVYHDGEITGYICESCDYEL